MPVIIRKKICFYLVGSITGALTISQYSSSNVLRITGELVGEAGVLADGEHGFHIHEFGELGDSCGDAGGHYNPMGVMILNVTLFRKMNT